MPRVVVRYLTGSRANEADVLSTDSGEELIAGRDPLASIHFDPEQDDLVSRQHLKITQDPNNPAVFRLVDLQSRNGTFVNGRRVYGSTFLSHNDRVQLGPSGPEFQFELDPPPAYSSGLTSGVTTSEFSNAMGRTPPLTRETFSGYSSDLVGAGPSRPIGRATVERMLDDTFGLLKQESTKGVIVGLLCIAAVLIVGVGTWMYMSKSAREASAAQRASLATMERAAREMTSAREDVKEQQTAQTATLREQLRQSEEARKKEMQTLSSAINSIRKNQTTELARQKQLTTLGVNAGAGAGANGPTVQGPLTFDQLVARVDGLFAENKYSEAAAVADQMIQLDPNRYEGYFFGGVSALELKQTPKAKEMLTRAIVKAPLDKQGPIQQLLTETAQHRNN